MLEFLYVKDMDLPKPLQLFHRELQVRDVAYPTVVCSQLARLEHKAARLRGRSSRGSDGAHSVSVDYGWSFCAMFVHLLPHRS